MYNWVDLPCACCDSALHRQLGYRGGEAHRRGCGQRCRVVKCTRCGHIYPSPMPIIKDLNLLYTNGDSYFARHKVDARIGYRADLLKEFEALLGRKGRVLDVGCGRGEMLSAARSSGWDAQGVEPSREFAEFARQHYGVEVKNCTLQAAEYPDNHFDAVTLGAVIEHLYYPKQALLEINRILKPAGLLWADAPNEASLFNLMGNLYFRILGKDWVTHLFPTFPPYHVQGFTRKSFNLLLRNTGFHLERLRLFSVRVKFSHGNFREHIEYYGAKAVRKMADLVRMGSYMELIARKTQSSPEALR